MTKQEAIEAMRRGEKVTHRFFDPGEYVTQKGFIVRTEDSMGIDVEVFWKDRSAVQWESDWEIYQEDKTKVEDGNSNKMEDKILKQIENKYPVNMVYATQGHNAKQYDSNLEKREAAKLGYNIRESVDVEMSNNIKIVLPSATSACKYDIQVKSMVGEILFEHTFYGNSKPLIKESVDEKHLTDGQIQSMALIKYPAIDDQVTLKILEQRCDYADGMKDYRRMMQDFSATKNTVSNEGEKWVSEFKDKLIKSLEYQKNALKNFDSQGILLENECTHKCNQITTIQLVIQQME